MTATISAGAAPASPTWRHFPAGENGFGRAPVLLLGQRDALLIDGGFTLSDGRVLAEAIAATGRTLTTVYVSQSDPDYYFGLGPIKHAFPSAQVLAAPETIEAIEASVAKKLQVWGPQLKDNGPQTTADVVIPAAFDTHTLQFEGEAIEIVAASGLVNRRHLWVPSLQAVFGGVLVFAGLHVWTADTPTPEKRAAWVEELEKIAARRPKVVVPGHMAPGAPTDASSLAFTRDYLVAFDEEVEKSADSAALVAAMKRRYPDLGGLATLEIGAKVAKNEMRWG